MTRIAVGLRAQHRIVPYEREQNPYDWRNTITNIGVDKSFVDDLNRERGIVSMRVDFVLRSAEIQPSVPKICA